MHSVINCVGPCLRGSCALGRGGILKSPQARGTGLRISCGLLPRFVGMEAEGHGLLET